MKILLFKGQFGYKEKEIHKGLIFLCNFERGDKERTLDKAAKKIIRLSKKEKVILVPFAHLSERSLSKKDSENLLRLFKEKIGSNRIILIPFGIKKEFFLYAKDKNDSIKLMNFK